MIKNAHIQKTNKIIVQIKDYYNIILDKLKEGNYRIGVNKSKPDKSDIKDNELPLHALNYIIYEYLKDYQDKRWKLIFDYVLVPNGVNNKDCDIDFTTIDFDDMLDFMISTKNIK